MRFIYAIMILIQEVIAVDLLMIKFYETTERGRWLHFVSGLIMIVFMNIAN